MKYILIEGYFHVVRYSPDGDSLMFSAKDPAHWGLIESEFRAEFEANLAADGGRVQLRLQGLDALETHYSAPPPPAPKAVGDKTFSGALKPSVRQLKQPPELAGRSADKLLSLLGVHSANWTSNRSYVQSIEVKKGSATETVSAKGQDRLEGYIIMNDIEMKGRPISWAYAGRPAQASGSEVSAPALEKALKQSANYQLLQSGLAYPYFFMTLSAKLRQVLLTGVQSAQKAKRGIWAQDKTMAGITLQHMSQLSTEHLVFPYLFRRLVKQQFSSMMKDYWQAVLQQKAHTPSPENLYLDRFFEDSNPYLFLIKEKDFVRLDSIVQIEGNRLKMSTSPANIVFLS